MLHPLLSLPNNKAHYESSYFVSQAHHTMSSGPILVIRCINGSVVEHLSSTLAKGSNARMVRLPSDASDDQDGCGGLEYGGHIMQLRTKNGDSERTLLSRKNIEWWCTTAAHQDCSESLPRLKRPSSRPYKREQRLTEVVDDDTNTTEQHFLALFASEPL